MRSWKMPAAALLVGLTVAGCGYIVTPDDEQTTAPVAVGKWAAVVTGVTQSSSGALHVDLAIRNDTGDWSALKTESKGAVRVASGGKSTDCGTVFVGTGGMSLAPGFIMRGYTGGSKSAPATQLLFVECAGVAKAAGQTLTIDYSFVTGPFNYYVASRVNKASLSLKLDQVAADTVFPVATTVKDLIEPSGQKIDAINHNKLTLVGATRSGTTLELSWENENPSDYPVYVHIGNPSVIGSDGVVYGFYESPHLAITPITLSKGKAQWKTSVEVPAEVSGLYILVSVESKQQKYFVNHALDITDK